MSFDWNLVKNWRIHPLLEVVLLLTPFILVIITFFMTAQLVKLAPPNTEFALVNGKDMYISAIRQGMQGHWKTIVPFTTTDPTRVFGFNFFFIILGQVNRFIQLDPIMLYQLSRLLTATFMFLTTYIALRQIFPKILAIVSYVLIFNVETAIRITWQGLTTFDSLFTNFWQYQYHQLAEKNIGMPHHMFGKGIGALLVVFYIKFINKPTYSLALLLCVCSFLTGLILPHFTIIFLLCGGPVLFLWSVYQKKLKNFILGSLLLVLIFLVPVVFLQFEFQKIPSLAHYTATEKSWWTNADVYEKYLYSLAFYVGWFLLSLIAIVSSFRKMSKILQLTSIISLAWLTLPLLYIQLSRYSFFPLANGRITDGYQYIPAGILASVGIIWISTIAARRFKTYFLVGCLALIVACSTVLSYFYAQQTVILRSAPWENIYPTDDFWSALNYLNTVPKGSGVMLHPLFSEPLVSYTDTHVYVGGGGLAYPHFETRSWLVSSFFRDRWTVEDARKFLLDNNIDYVMYGNPERNLYQVWEMPYLTIFEAVFITPSLTVYRLK